MRRKFEAMILIINKNRESTFFYIKKKMKNKELDIIRIINNRKNKEIFL